MTTTEQPAESSTKAKYLTDEYEVIRNGRTYWCRKVLYRGQVLEACRSERTVEEILLEALGEDEWPLSDEARAELTAYLDQFAIPRDEAPAE